MYIIQFEDSTHHLTFCTIEFGGNHSPDHEAEPLSSNVLTTAYGDIVCFKAAKFCMNKTFCLPSPTMGNYGGVPVLLRGLCTVSLPVPVVKCASFWRWFLLKTCGNRPVRDGHPQMYVNRGCC